MTSISGIKHVSTGLFGGAKHLSTGLFETCLAQKNPGVMVENSGFGFSISPVSMVMKPDF